MPSSHLFSCHQPDCSNMTTELGSTCDACRQDWRRCPDCGDTGATVLGSNYCHECYSRRNHPCNAPPAADGWCPECDMCTVVLPNICADCQQKRDNRCTCDGGDEPQCACNGSGRLCDFCAEEYAEPCRGCGILSQLWTDNTYCRKCYVERYGDEFPNEHATVHAEEIADLHLALGRAIAESDTRSQEHIQLLLEDHGYTSLQSIRDQISEIEERLLTNMTKGQRDDWVWLLQNRRADLVEAEKEMWAGYDKDDLQNRHGF
jgi:hypothetical protein